MRQLPAGHSLSEPVDWARSAAARRPPARQRADSPRLAWLAAALLWLLVGSVLLASTLVPAHTRELGWTPAFWLSGAPLIVLFGLRRSASMRQR